MISKYMSNVDQFLYIVNNVVLTLLSNFGAVSGFDYFSICVECSISIYRREKSNITFIKSIYTEK